MAFLTTNAISQRFLTQDSAHGRLKGKPGGPPRAVIKLHRIPRDIQAVADGIAFIRGMRLLEEICHLLQNFVGRKRKVFPQYRQLFFPLREVNENLRLQTRMNVLR